MRRNLALMATALVFTLAGALFGASQLRSTASITVVAALLNSSLPDAGGKSQALSQWQDKTLVINFWAPWCAPCVQEMPELSALQTEMGAENIQFIGIGIDSPSNITMFLSKYKISYPLYAADMQGVDLTRQFGNQTGGLPFTVLISKNGEIKKRYWGRITTHELRADLKKLIN